MKRLATMVLLLTVFCFQGRSASATPLVVDFESPVIEISVDFAGTDILFFGAIDGQGDVIVTVTGPLRSEIVRQKSRVAGIWVNANSRVFETVPAYYHVAATRSLKEIAPPQLFNHYQIGAPEIQFGYAPEQAAGDLAAYRDALIRNKQRLGLYNNAPNKIDVRGGQLFRTTFSFPANVTTGTYNVDVYLIRKGRIVSTRSRALSITKVGVGATIFDFAHQHAPIYGIMAVVVALFAGWLAGALFRKT